MRVEEVDIGPTAPGNVAVVTFDQSELAIVLFEALVDVEHPAHMTIEEIIADIDRMGHSDVLDDMHRCAVAAIDYFIERLNKQVQEPKQ